MNHPNRRTSISMGVALLALVAFGCRESGDLSSEAPLDTTSSALSPTSPALASTSRSEATIAPEVRQGAPTTIPNGQRAGTTTTVAPTTVPPPPTTAAPVSTSPPTLPPPAPTPPPALPVFAPPPPAPAPTAAPTPPPAPAPPAPSADEQARAVAVSVQLLNQERAEVGLAPLALDASMNTFARDWSRTMASSGFGHSSGPYGENVAWHSDDTMSAEAAATYFNGAWRDSPGHYANMTDDRYTHVGIGFHHDGSGWWATHVFR